MSDDSEKEISVEGDAQMQDPPPYETVVIPSLTEQEELIKDFEIEDGKEYFLISRKWMNSYNQLLETKDDSRRMDSIDNSDLLEEDFKFKSNNMERYDYLLVTKEQWEYLVKWYGVKKYHTISRFAYGKNVEVYPFIAEVTYHPPEGESKTHKFEVPKQAEVQLLKDKACEHFGVPREESRIATKDSFDPLTAVDLNRKIDYAFYSYSKIFLQVKDSTGRWYFPKEKSSSSYSSYSSFSKNAEKGAVGLMNLGNTCFMNSSLQCLSNTEPLVSYFLDSKKFINEINRNNPLGMKGEIAENFAELMNEIWTTDSSYVSPRPLKSTIGQFAPQFSGYAQHDSQELLAFLLDGLHEDLNRIVMKPYIESSSDEGKNDEQIANESWGNHKKRNDSIVVDLFQGLLKSTVSCPRRTEEDGKPACGKVSVTFDPYMFLSLHLPVESSREIKITVKTRSRPSSPLMVKVIVQKKAPISQIIQKVSSIVSIPKESLTLCEVWNSGVRLFSSYQTASSIDEKDEIYCYENEIAEDDEKLKTHVNIFVALATESSSYYSSLEKFGVPLRITVPREVLQTELYATIYETLILYGYLKDEKIADLDKSKLFKIQKSSYDKEIQADSSIEVAPDIQIYAIFDSITKKNIFSETEFAFCEKHPSLDINPEGGQGLSIGRCLKLLGEEEQLGENDKWYCPQCKEHLQAFKKVQIWSLPEILVVHLKRFSFDHYSRDKIDNYVDFPIKDLDLKEFAYGPLNPNQSTIYDLYAISNHYGGLGGGHYTAYAKNKHNGQWYSFDDSNVSKIDENNIKTAAAYVLFYKRRSDTTQNRDNLEN